MLPCAKPTSYQNLEFFILFVQPNTQVVDRDKFFIILNALTYIYDKKNKINYLVSKIVPKAYILDSKIYMTFILSLSSIDISCDFL